MATYEQLMDAARRAHAANDASGAKRLLEMALEQKKPQKDLGQRMLENIVGDDDPTTDNFGETVANLLNMGGEALTLGLVGDEASAATDAMLGRGTYKERLQVRRDQEARTRQNNPILSFGAEVAPAMLLPLGAAATGTNMAMQAGRGALASGAAGGLYGYLEGEGTAQDRAVNARNTGFIAAAGGAASPFVARGFARRLNRSGNKQMQDAAIRNAPSGGQLRRNARAAYEAAENVEIPRNGLSDMVQRASSKIRRRPINPKLTPRTAALVDELTDVATAPGSSTMPFGDLEDVRQMTRAARGDFTNPADQRGGAIVADAIDKFINGIDPELSKEITRARQMWSRLRKHDLLEEAVAKAQNQASGFENGIRVQVRQILNSKKKRAGFTKAEIEAMEEIVQGTRLGNLMKRIGKFGLGRGQQTNVMSGTVGAAVFGPGSLAAGQAALAGSEALTSRQARKLMALVRSGGTQNARTLQSLAPSLQGYLSTSGQALSPLLADQINQGMLAR